MASSESSGKRAVLTYEIVSDFDTLLDLLREVAECWPHPARARCQTGSTSWTHTRSIWGDADRWNCFILVIVVTSVVWNKSGVHLHPLILPTKACLPLSSSQISFLCVKLHRDALNVLNILKCFFFEHVMHINWFCIILCFECFLQSPPFATEDMELTLDDADLDMIPKAAEAEAAEAAKEAAEIEASPVVESWRFGWTWDSMNVKVLGYPKVSQTRCRRCNKSSCTFRTLRNVVSRLHRMHSKWVEH